jgi:hypothetical protein
MRSNHCKFQSRCTVDQAFVYDDRDVHHWEQTLPQCESDYAHKEDHATNIVRMMREHDSRLFDAYSPPQAHELLLGTHHTFQPFLKWAMDAISDGFLRFVIEGDMCGEDVWNHLICFADKMTIEKLKILLQLGTCSRQRVITCNVAISNLLYAWANANRCELIKKFYFKVYSWEFNFALLADHSPEGKISMNMCDECQTLLMSKPMRRKMAVQIIKLCVEDKITGIRELEIFKEAFNEVFSSYDVKTFDIRRYMGFLCSSPKYAKIVQMKIGPINAKTLIWMCENYFVDPLVRNFEMLRVAKFHNVKILFAVLMRAVGLCETISMLKMQKEEDYVMVKPDETILSRAVLKYPLAIKYISDENLLTSPIDTLERKSGKGKWGDASPLEMMVMKSRDMDVMRWLWICHPRIFYTGRNVFPIIHHMKKRRRKFPQLQMMLSNYITTMLTLFDLGRRSPNSPFSMISKFEDLLIMNFLLF